MSFAVFFAAHAAEASAPDEPSTRELAREALAEAERADTRLEFAEALAAYDRVATLDPSLPAAGVAAVRAQAIRARSEDAFRPLARLERVRRDPKLASDPAAIDALVVEADSFPPGLVRAEAYALGAEAYSTRLGQPDRAVPLWAKIASDGEADRVLVRSARSSLVAHHLARGEGARALDAARPDEALVTKVIQTVRRRRLRFASFVVLTPVVVLTSGALVRAKRRGRTLVGILRRAGASIRLFLAFAAYLAIAGAALATGYEGGAGLPFLVFGAALVPLFAVARVWSVAGSPRTSARVARAVLCGASALGTAFLVLERLNAGWLDGLGL
jgi:hypothetical protein